MTMMDGNSAFISRLDVPMKTKQSSFRELVKSRASSSRKAIQTVKSKLGSPRRQPRRWEPDPSEEPLEMPLLLELNDTQVMIDSLLLEDTSSDESSSDDSGSAELPTLFDTPFDMTQSTPFLVEEPTPVETDHCDDEDSIASFELQPWITVQETQSPPQKDSVTRQNSVSFADEAGKQLEFVYDLEGNISQLDRVQRERFLVLLISVDRRKFEYINVEHALKLRCTVRDILDQVPTFTSDPFLRNQTYTACRRLEDGNELINSISIATYHLARNEILVLIPDGYTGDHVVAVASSLGTAPSIQKVIRRTGRASCCRKRLVSRDEFERAQQVESPPRKVNLFHEVEVEQTSSPTSVVSCLDLPELLQDTPEFSPVFEDDPAMDAPSPRPKRSPMRIVTAAASLLRSSKRKHAPL